MNENALEQLEVEIDEAKKQIELLHAVQRLQKNKDFKKVFMDGYFKDTAAHLVLLKALPEMQTKEHQESIITRIDAIGHLREHIRSIYQMGNMAKASMDDKENTRTEILAEAS